MTSKQNTTVEMDLDTLMELQDLPIDEVIKKAQELNLEVSPDATQSQIVDAIAAATGGGSEAEEATAPEAGVLFSLTSQSERDKQLMRMARDRITQNKEAGNYISMYLKNKDGRPYDKRTPALPVKNVDRLLPLIKTVPDGSQDEFLAEFKANPEAFEQPQLIMKRTRRDGRWGGAYVMLYLRKKQGRIAVAEF